MGAFGLLLWCLNCWGCVWYVVFYTKKLCEKLYITLYYVLDFGIDCKYYITKKKKIVIDLQLS